MTFLTFLAQATSSEIGTWVLVAILIINGVGAVGGLVAIFATRREVEAIEKRVTAAEELRDEDRKEGSERRAKIYGELKAQREDFQHELKSCQERSERIEQKFMEIVRGLPSEIIATLRNLGHLRDPK